MSFHLGTLPRPTATEQEVYRLIRQVADRDWSRPNLWALASMGSSLAGLAALFPWYLGQDTKGLVSNALTFATVAYLFARRASFPTPDASVDSHTMKALLASPVLHASFKQACRLAQARGELTYHALMDLAQVSPGRDAG
jgi:hypothetical protein